MQTRGSGQAPFQSHSQPPIPFFLTETDTTELNIYKKPPIYRQKGEWGCLSHGTGHPGALPHPPLCPAEHHSGTHHGKHPIEDLIIESSKFPAAQPPDPNQPAKIETDYWPCPPSLAVVGRWGAGAGEGMGCARGFIPPDPPTGVLGMGITSPLFPPETEWRRRMASKRGEEEEEDLTEEMKNLRELQRQELSKVRGRAGRRAPCQGLGPC